MRGRIDAGVVRIAADVRDRRVVAATVSSDRPRGLAAALARHPPGAIPDLARQLFALCGISHAVAATQALSMAGAGIDRPSPQTATRFLAAERIAAHLQATFIGWSTAVPTTIAETAALSRALAATRSPAVDVDGLAVALGALGMASRPWFGSWAHRLLIAANDDTGAGRPDALGAADDDAVLAALDGYGEAFAAAPWLSGRRPETGPAARAALRGLHMDSPAERLRARLDEIGEAARILAGVTQPDPADWFVAGRLAPGIGFGAVETPRGRLHHLVQLRPAGDVERYLILAPTEWNFAADGPFVAALQDLRIGTGAARPAIERLASLYDPCVGCDIKLHEVVARDAPVPEDRIGARSNDVRNAAHLV